MHDTASLFAKVYGRKGKMELSNHFLLIMFVLIWRHIQV